MRFLLEKGMHSGGVFSKAGPETRLLLGFLPK